MCHKEMLKTGLIASTASLALMLGALPGTATAQTANPAQPYPYPQQAAAPQMDPAQMAAAMPAQAHPIRQLFAGTIATLLNATSAGLAVGLQQGVTGAISSWFNRQNSQAQY